MKALGPFLALLILSLAPLGYAALTADKATIKPKARTLTAEDTTHLEKLSEAFQAKAALYEALSEESAKANLEDRQPKFAKIIAIHKYVNGLADIEDLK